MYSSCLNLNGDDARLVFQKVLKMEDGRSLGRSLLTNDEPRRCDGQVGYRTGSSRQYESRWETVMKASM